MSLAENLTAVPAPATAGEAAEVTLQGRVDAIDGGRLFGWVWDRARPSDRMNVRVLLEGREIAATRAERPRIDLRRNGIGDGGYAFDIALAPEAAAAAAKLTVVAVSPTTGDQTALRHPSADERAAEAAVAAPMARVLERLDLLVAAQRQTLSGQREAAQALRDTTKRMEQLALSEDGVAVAVDAARKGQEDTARRLGDLEVFLVRFDGALAGFDVRLKELGERDTTQLKPLMLVFAALGGVAAGVIASLAVGI